MRIVAVSSLALIGSVLALSAGATPPPEPPPARGDAARGQTLFTEIGCAGCHGPAGIPLVGLDFYSQDELAALIASPPSDLMPAFALETADADDLTAYLRQTYK